MGQIMFVRDQTTRKCQRSCSVHPVGVRSDEGDATAEAESIPSGCSGTGNLFVFLYNFVGRSNQINSALMAQFLSFSCHQKNWPQSAVGRKNLWPFYVTALVFVCYTLGGQENFVGMWTENPSGLDHVRQRLDNKKMLEIVFCPPRRCQKR